MIVIKVELWPFGDESKARQIALGKISNDGTGDQMLGNYDAEFICNLGIKTSQVTNHNRGLSAWKLISKALKEAYK